MKSWLYFWPRVVPRSWSARVNALIAGLSYGVQVAVSIWRMLCSSSDQVNAASKSLLSPSVFPNHELLCCACEFSEGHDVVEYGLIITGASHSGALRHGRWFKADPELGTTTGVLTLPATASLLWIQAQFNLCFGFKLELSVTLRRGLSSCLSLPALLSNLETQAMNFAVKEWYQATTTASWSCRGGFAHLCFAVAAAGATALTIGYPLDFTATRLATGTESASHK